MLARSTWTNTFPGTQEGYGLVVSTMSLGAFSFVLCDDDAIFPVSAGTRPFHHFRFINVHAHLNWEVDSTVVRCQ